MGQRHWQENLRQRLAHLRDVVAPQKQAAAAQPEARRSIIDAYVTTAPSTQNAVDIFRGEWSSEFPAPWQDVRAGGSKLFEDVRLQWALDQIGGVKGQTVLELGPLEAGHTYMLEHAGAASIVAIEANTRAYLKCLVVKELMGLQKAQFLCGDFVEYLRAEPRRFDLCVASGVLYHMREPVELIELISRVADRIFLWTHYYDGQIIQANPKLAPDFSPPETRTHGGFEHQLYRHQYAAALERQDFCGAGSQYTNWLTRDQLLAAMQHFGFDSIQIAHEQPDHIHGPALSLLATRS